MRNPFPRLFHSRDKPSAANAVSSAPVFYMGSSVSGKQVNERTAMQTTAVYACVRVIAETVASLPLHTYRAVSHGKERAADHPLYPILHSEPNAEMTSFVFRECLMTHLLLWGNAYAQIIRDGRGRVVGLYPLLPDRMTVDRDSRGRLTYTYLKDGLPYGLDPADILHIPGLGFDGIMGHSPIALARNAIGLNIAAEEYGGRFFANGANPSGILTTPGVIKDPEKVRTAWHSAYSGNNAHKVAVLEEGLHYERISIPNNDAQFLETRKFQIEEICRIFQVPPHLVASLDRATFSNIESQSISFVVHTIRPWLVRWEQALDRALFSDKEKNEYFASFIVDGLLRGDYKSRMEGYAIAIQNGFMSPNDVRSLENLNPIPSVLGGDLYAMNGNMLQLKDIGAFIKKAPEQTEPVKKE
jgi:HK97 family phage portal protein